MKPDILTGGSKMARVMKLTALLCVLLTLVSFPAGILPLTITAATCSYHLLMRLAVGFTFDRTLNNHVNVRLGWFQLRGWEKALYERLKVGQWKASLPTYDPDAFDRRQHTWDEIAQAMCQAELVHEVIILLSFLPVLASIWLGDMVIFLVAALPFILVVAVFAIVVRIIRRRKK